MPNASTAVCTMRAGAVEVADGVVVGHRFTAERLDLLAHLRGRVFFGAAPVERDADVVDDDLGAFAPEAQRELAPDAASGTGDDRDPPVEESHRQPADGRGRRAGDRLVAVLVRDREVEVDEVLAALLALGGDRPRCT